MIILNKTYGFTSGALAAPQANAMAAVIEPLMSGVGAPWLLYGIGAVLAIVLTFFKIPALAFALGMFIPLELNVPLVVPSTGTLRAAAKIQRSIRNEVKREHCWHPASLREAL